jgi:hypothetical protein
MALLDWAVLAVRQAAGEGEAPGPTGESRAPTLYGFMGSFGPLALITVILRFYTRIRFAHLGWDDITIAIGMVLYTGLIVATVFGKTPTYIHVSWSGRVETDIRVQRCATALVCTSGKSVARPNSRCKW